MKSGVYRLFRDEREKVDMVEKVKLAVQIFMERTQLVPNVGILPPGTTAVSVNGIEICESQLVMPNHLIIGREER